MKRSASTRTAARAFSLVKVAALASSLERDYGIVPTTIERHAGGFEADAFVVDGSWFVKTRALAFQPYFDNHFPYAHDQWISAAGSSWATMALSLAAPAPQAARASAGLRFR